ncbi:MAG: phenylacetate--CoA ligase family protein [Alcanivoracaceae bacterium]|nr:phenylacetate--CoA ligase family protein [Alcanivoracaceae bacterium]
MMHRLAGGYEWLFRNLLYPLYEQRLRGRNTLHQMAEFNARDQWTVEQLQQWQLAALKRLLRHAADQVPWYQQQIRDSGLIPEDMTSVADIAILPVLTKSLVREHYQDLIANNFRGKTFSKRTGGSTGEPFCFEITREDYERRMAVMWRGYSRSGARMGRRTLYLWGADILPGTSLAAIKNQLYHQFFQRRMLNSFAMNDSNLADYVDDIRRYRPQIIVGYVTPLYELARYMVEQGEVLPKLAGILTGAEPLRSHQRAIIEQAFSAPVFNTYGCREVMLIASEAPDVDGMLVNADQLLLESVDEQGRAVREQPGQLLLTDLHAFGMPLIRYANGDVVSLSDTPAAGLPWPRLTSVEGRQLDLIRTTDGRLVPGEFFPHLLKDIAGVERFQVVQKTLEHLLVRIVAGSEFDDAARRLLMNALHTHLGADLQVDLQLVSEIPLTASGKLRVTISELESC